MHLVRIRIADAGRIALHAEKIMDGIPQYYVQQYRRIKKKQEADQELAAGFLLKKYLNVSSDAQFVRLEHGKPVLKSGNSFFNLSHSGEYTVLAAADIDIGDKRRPLAHGAKDLYSRTAGTAGADRGSRTAGTVCKILDRVRGSVKTEGHRVCGRDCDVRHRAGEDWIRRRETAFEGLFVQVQGIHDCMCCIWSVLCIS